MKKNGIVSDSSKLQPLSDSNYRRCSEELMFFFEETGLDYIFTEDAGTVGDGITSDSAQTQSKKDSSDSVQDGVKKQKKYETFEEHNRNCRGRIIRHFSKKLFDIYVGYDSTKEIWLNLKKKNGGEDKGKKQYITSQWTCFKIRDNEHDWISFMTI